MLRPTWATIIPRTWPEKNNRRRRDEHSGIKKLASVLSSEGRIVPPLVSPETQFVVRKTVFFCFIFNSDALRIQRRFFVFFTTILRHKGERSRLKAAYEVYLYAASKGRKVTLETGVFHKLHCERCETWPFHEA